MRIYDPNDRAEKIGALTERYRLGEISETVYRVSLGFFMPEDDVRAAVCENQVFFRNSLPFKRGEIS